MNTRRSRLVQALKSVLGGQMSRRILNSEGAKDQMKAWFQEHYKNPADGVPFDSAEGGYIYINGGPYDASEVLFDEFGTRYPEQLINEVAEELEAEATEWVKLEDY